MPEQILVAKTPVKYNSKTLEEGYVGIDNELFYRIAHYDRMNPFFMSIVSNSDHWMFISSNGALTAGRKNPDHALFPYYTDDKIQDSAEITGSKTVMLVTRAGRRFIWEPFSSRYQGLYDIDRNIYKNVCGNKIIFEEINHDLDFCFRYRWLNSEKFGFVRKSQVINTGRHSAVIALLDGIQNIMPYGISQRFQADYSTLADAYRKNELETDSALGIYSLSSIPVDKAEPSEALKATTVWSAGITVRHILLSSTQLDSFRLGRPVIQETDKRAVRGAYLMHIVTSLGAHRAKEWYTVAEVDQDAAGVAALKRSLADKSKLIRELEADIKAGTANLTAMVATADGMQQSADLLSTSRHFSNVAYNIMRGGVFLENYQIETGDFISFVRTANKKVHQRCAVYLKTLPARIDFGSLLERILKKKDAGLERLCYEYLPLIFSRRHGDPSRPWNWFSIDIKDDHGEKNLNYQGNWRDIFQNWEALVLSFPVFIENMICKFVNASTADGYNPYRITRSGFEWEVLDPADAWSYIGYWGDHQIIYLLKLLELSKKYHPGKLVYFLTRDVFVYADVPYRIKSYRQILADPHNTVDFDQGRDLLSRKRVRQTGSDGKLILCRGAIYHVNLAEKLLVPVLSKLSNFIPGAGIWMNTQRPEWNDANNALVGYGVSMVTLYYLRRHIMFCRDLFKNSEPAAIPISAEVVDWYNAIFRELEKKRPLLQHKISDHDRKKIIDRLGEAAGRYRNKIYRSGFSGQRQVLRSEQLVNFCGLVLEYIDHSIRAGRRRDHLYHAYNLIRPGKQKVMTVRNLYEMLEGQVAVLTSGFLSAGEAIQLLKALRKSKLYRRDQSSYILYPDRQLPRFTGKNIIPSAVYRQSELLQKLVIGKNKKILLRDAAGGLHFNGIFRHARDLSRALDELPDDLQYLVKKEKDLVLRIFEDLFDHQSFTGRSGTFYKYEGLGCIYWHMVSKLLLAVQENYYRAVQVEKDKSKLRELRKHYYDIRGGLGLAKSAGEYGGFPTDPYSHTPGHSGAQQPGMTGQVKEDIISRFGELGVRVHDGGITFWPGLLRREEFLDNPVIFSYYNTRNEPESIWLSAKCLAFTVAQVPVIYHLAAVEKIMITIHSGKIETLTGLSLDQDLSLSVFNRSGEIKRLDVYLKL